MESRANEAPSSNGTDGKRSGGDAVLVDKPAEAVRSLYAANTFEAVLGHVWDRHFEVDAAVRALAVVVGHELTENAVEVALAPDEQPVQALSSCCAHKSFRERVRLGGSNGCPDNSGACRTQYLVKGPNKLVVPVADQEPEGSPLVLESSCQVAGLLGDPGSDGVGRNAGQEHRAALHVDEKRLY